MSKDNNIKKNKAGKKIIDLTNYISADMVRYDENGSYTGITKNTYNGDLEQPIQDADDL